MNQKEIDTIIVEPLNIKGVESGALSGQRFVAKDNFDVAGYSTGAGVPDWKKTHSPASKSAPAVVALLAAGAELIGKSCMDELAFSLDGINMHFGTPPNPNLPGCIPGGSSSGSASAVASGLCDFAIGTDTAGSVRVPAAFCGIYSMRPTHGRISTEGIVPLGPSFDTVGWFARDPQLLALCGEVLFAGTKELKGSSNPDSDEFNSSEIRIFQNAIDLLDPSLKEPFLETLTKIAPSRKQESFVSLPVDNLPRWVALLDTIRSWEAWQYFGAWIESTQPHMQELMRQRVLNCRNVSESEMLRARAEQAQASLLIDEWIGDQVICFPTTFNWPLPVNSSDSERAFHRSKNLQLTILAGVAGLPQLNIPIVIAGSQARFGLSLLGKRGTDQQLLALARNVGLALA
jgi:amidase